MALIAHTARELHDQHIEAKREQNIAEQAPHEVKMVAVGECNVEAAHFVRGGVVHVGKAKPLRTCKLKYGVRAVKQRETRGGLDGDALFVPVYRIALAHVGSVLGNQDLDAALCLPSAKAFGKALAQELRRKLLVRIIGGGDHLADRCVFVGKGDVVGRGPYQGRTVLDSAQNLGGGKDDILQLGIQAQGHLSAALAHGKIEITARVAIGLSMMAG